MDDLGPVEINKADVIREGWLMKQSRFLRDWRRRWVVLTPEYLLSFRSPSSDYSAKHVTEFLKLNECSTVKSMEDATGCKFRVDSRGRTFVLIGKWITGTQRSRQQPR
ncbi:MAG: uncharacterized protein KVP18_000465 [Porospora cf. gigantea A]|uniref:uncharacterized protein n=1 Tax=Porospora cf. gigantea A TaxID=2853593 RepID=UPI003559C951|nr:MAG: hypothetical protein KVP18_000465 [Porospora cf. gigantea A]